MLRRTGVKKYIIVATYSILLYLGLSNISEVMSALRYAFGIISPIITGICIAFVVNILMRFVENRVLAGMGKKHKKLLKYKRMCSMLITYVSVLAFIVAISLFIGPQIGKSASTFVTNAPGYIENVQEWTNKTAAEFNLSNDVWDKLLQNWEDISTAFTTFLSSSLMHIFNFTVNFTSSVVNFFMSFILSVYMLYSKEKLLGILKKIMYAVIKSPYAEKIMEICAQTNSTFSRFIGGQLTESLILGSLCFIGMAILGIPYAPLVAVLMGLTSLFPIVGAYIGTITSALIIMMESPIKALVFVIFILCLQQIEGNLIYPRVVGNAIGLNGFWVFSAIILGGGMMGVTGILLAVPMTALIYTLVRELVHKRLKEKGLDDMVKVEAPPGVKEAKAEIDEQKRIKKEKKNKPLKNKQ